MAVIAEENKFKRLREALIILLLTLLFFGLFVLIVSLVFPVGTGLKTYNNEESTINLVGDALRDILFMRNSDEYDPYAEDGDYAAILTQTNNTVRARRAGHITWRIAKAGMGLIEGDSVQTNKTSTAAITFDENNYLNVGNNSLVVISRLSLDGLTNRRSAVAVMAEGEIWGRLEQKEGGKTTVVEIATPNGLAKIRSNSSGDKPIDFKINIEDDQSTSFVVYEGQLEIENQDGELTVLEANKQLILKDDGVFSTPLELLEAVVLAAPPNRQRYTYRDLPPRLFFAWKSMDGVEQYRIQIASDAVFRHVAMDTQVYDNEFEFGNLRPGTYYWRVVSRNVDGVEGALSDAWKFVLIRDRIPPKLNVKFPPTLVKNPGQLFSGETEIGATVFINQERVKVDHNGKFGKKIKLKRGVNIIVVEALDAAGNVAYQSELFTGKF
ncbi:MAG: hypothetical protein OEZ58_01870 [Gammaproteobacteria bacterium]|nr:hypothetical protein [Gammaproteobacteria bacterium]